MRMDDVAGPSYSRPPSWQKVVERRDGGTVTENVQFTETGHDPLEPNNVSTQTENDSQLENQHISIPIETIKAWESSVVEAQKTRKLFDKLTPFHVREAARIQLSRTVTVTAMPTEALPVQKIVVGPNGRVALLLASQEHETWCSHNSHVVVCHWNKQYCLPQAVCPTSAAWGRQGLLAVASYAGAVELYHGQQLLSSSQIHEGPVTAIDWTGREIITSGTDGCVILSIVKGTSIEKEKTIRLTVSDLPRQIRKGAPGSKALGIVSISRREKDLAVASETGGIWKLQLPELILVPSAATPVPIEEIILLPGGEGRLVLKDVDQHISVMSSGGLIESESLVSSSRWLFTTGGLLISSDEETLTILDTVNLRQLCQTPLKLLAAASSGIDEIMILNEHSELQIYGITY